MYLLFNIKTKVVKFFLWFLILSQLSNALLVSDLLISKDQIILNSDLDNNSKEEKNSFDFEEEIKILENYFHSIYFLNDSKTINYLVQDVKDVLKTKDFPPPEIIL
tara:strand:- start:1215 stop:1532 length:318 start_codon:yes stop_codon:yes gene_type:complete